MFSAVPCLHRRLAADSHAEAINLRFPARSALWTYLSSSDGVKTRENAILRPVCTDAVSRAGSRMPAAGLQAWSDALCRRLNRCCRQLAWQAVTDSHAEAINLRFTARSDLRTYLSSSGDVKTRETAILPTWHCGLPSPGRFVSSAGWRAQAGMHGRVVKHSSFYLLHCSRNVVLV